MRFALGVEYDGSDFSGWESQPRRRTIQSTLETALACVADCPAATVCAGRTDAGVHAVAQVVHFDSGADRAPHEWVLGANSNLPGDVSVRWAAPVAEIFHARYSAVCRYYRYVIQNRRERSAHLLREECELEVPEAGPSVLLWDGGTEPAHLGGALPELFLVARVRLEYLAARRERRVFLQVVADSLGEELLVL